MMDSNGFRSGIWMFLKSVAEHPELLDDLRLEIENELVKRRGARVSTMYNNGLVIKEVDGSPSDVIRMGHAEALCIALHKLANMVKNNEI